ncbi:MAG TPA: hypothetical protein VF618_15850 [Thermoanaerobaculia bacterium]
MAGDSLYDRIVRAALWVAAFCFAAGVFLSLTLMFRGLPVTEPVAIGLVTIQRVSKFKDYLGAALFFLLVPPLTVYFHRLGTKLTRGFDTTEALLFTGPFLLSPLFYLTTGKFGWVLLLPIALAYGAVNALRFARTRRWLRDIFRQELQPYHALLFAEGLSWIVYRYLTVGKRIAHIPTLFLEVVFVAGFLALFWGVALLICRLSELNFGVPAEEMFRRLTSGALPFALLPIIAVVWIPMTQPRLVMAAVLLLSALIAMRRPIGARTAWRLAAFVILPGLVYIFSYASTASLSQWVDLFHRGEAIGPASDYLRGKAPYREVFALHGMLEDGLLDAWLFELFGRSLEVAINRTVILGAFLGVAIWFLGLVLFESIPLAVLCVAMGSWTTAENNRTFFQVAAVALFWHALRRRSRVAAVASGVFGGVALFFSYEIGVFTIAGALATCVIIAIARRRVAWEGLSPARAATFFLLGLTLGAAPFLIYLASRGALGDFFTVSFVTIPRIIDAVWSLPFPDLVSTFRKNLNLHALADFVLWEKFHLILSPLTIAIAAAYLIHRWLRRRLDQFDYALLVLTVFATVAQRSAFGRAEFRHQYFAAFLIGPMLVLLGILVVRVLRRTWARGDEGTHAFVALLVFSAIPVVGILFWIPDLLNARIDDMIRYYPRVLRVHQDGQAEEVRWRITEVSKEIGELTRRNEPIFDFSNQPAFYFFANRPNPTRFYQVPILSPREFQAETITALERTKPKVIIRTSPELFDQFDGVPNDLRAQAVSAYIDDAYRYHKTIRGVELWTRKADAKPARVAEYLRRIRLPHERELVAGAMHRMVFPAVGSLPGASGNYWVSDLTLHNPFRAPITITLRYVAGETRIDRRLTIGPRQTIRWADVVKDFFGVPNTIGALWIRHREGRAPVAVVKTVDIARGGRASVETPLTPRDAATFGSDASELTIVGIPTAHDIARRVNVGIVNVGRIPGTFRVTARSREGKLIGRFVESGVPEDEVWMVPDVERELGVRLDESTTLRVTAIAGTGVAFATVVEPSGDNEFIAAIPAQPQ